MVHRSKARRVLLLALTGLLFAGSSVVFQPSDSAQAASPPPVVPLPSPGDYVTKMYEHSRVSAPVGSELYAEQMAKAKADLDDALRAQGKAVVRPAASGSSAASTARILTGASTVTRTVGAGALIGTAAQFGWAIGQAGLSVYATATGKQYEDIICDQPDWYQGLNSVALFGLSSSCAAVQQPQGNYQPERLTSEKCVVLKDVAPRLPNSSVSTQIGTWLSCRTPYSGFRVNMPAGGIDVYVSTPLSNAAFQPVPSDSTLVPIRPDSNFRYVVFFKGVQGLLHTTPVQVGAPANDAVQNDYYNKGTGTIMRTPVPFSVHSDDPQIVDHGWQIRVGGVWQDLDSSKQSVKPGAEAERQIQCQVTWTDGTVTSGVGATYIESGHLPASAGEWGCTSATNANWNDHGKWPQKITVTSSKAGSTAPADTQVVHETDFPPTTTEERTALTSPVSTGLELWKGSQSCMTWEADCGGWWETTSSGATPGTYKCTFGSSPVSLTQCSPYRSTFDSPSTETLIKPEPDSEREIKWVNENDWLNTVDPGDSISPSGECMKGWGSAPDPISWVMHPVKCALVWAFVPRQSVVQKQSDDMIKAWKPTMPGQIVDAATHAFTPPEGSSGCTGPHVYIPMTIFGNTVTIDWYPLWACDGVGAQVASLARTIGAAILIFMTVLGVVRRASATVNAPGLGSGGSS